MPQFFNFFVRKLFPYFRIRKIGGSFMFGFIRCFAQAILQFWLRSTWAPWTGQFMFREWTHHTSTTKAYYRTSVNISRIITCRIYSSYKRESQLNGTPTNHGFTIFSAVRPTYLCVIHIKRYQQKESEPVTYGDCAGEPQRQLPITLISSLQ